MPLTDGGLKVYLRLNNTPTALEEDLSLTADSLPLLHQWQARVGSVVTVVAPQGGYFRGRLLDDRGGIRLFQKLPAGMEPLAPRRLCQALPDKERMSWIIQKAVELGVTAIQPLITQQCAWFAKPNGGRPSQDKSASWQKVAREAAVQCRRALLPQVHPPLLLADLLATVAAPAIMITLETMGNPPPLVTLAPQLARQSLTILVGPEGGFTEEERHLMQQAGAVALSLGGRILRTETATLTALALLAAWDDPLLRH